MAQIIVKNEIGVDELGNSYPAPNIPDTASGETIEAELVWQIKAKDDNVYSDIPLGMWHPENNKTLYKDYDEFSEKVSWGYTTRQIWKLSEEQQELPDASWSATRIAELEARVAELEETLVELWNISSHDLNEKVQFRLTQINNDKFEEIYRRIGLPKPNQQP